MPVESFRFVHAGEIRLDEQIQDLDGISDWERTTLQDATLESFSNIVDLCISTSADLLLLNGQIFSDDGPTLRACVLLKNSFHRLVDDGVRVIVSPDDYKHFQDENTLRFLDIENVEFLSPWNRETNFLDDAQDEVIKITRLSQEESSDLTSLTAQTFVEDDIYRIGIASGQWSSFSDSWGLENKSVSKTKRTKKKSSKRSESNFELNFDYLAVSGVASHRVFDWKKTTVCNPGTIQSVKSSEHGLHGCHCINIQDGILEERTFYPTSSVLRMNVDLELDLNLDWDSLVLSMQEKIQDLVPDSAKLVSWKWLLSGEGELIETLRDSEFQKELIGAVAENFENDAFTIRQTIEFEPELDENSTSSSEELEIQFLDSLRQIVKQEGITNGRFSIPEGLQSLFESSDLSPKRLAERLDWRHIQGTAKQLGADWLSKNVNEDRK